MPVLLLQRHEEGVILQPVTVLFAESGVAISGNETGKGFAQQSKAGVPQPAVVHTLGVVPIFQQLFFRKKSGFLQLGQVDEIGIARLRAGGLVGAVAVGGGVDGQDLPAGLLRFYKKIHKIPGALSQ